MSVPPSLRRQVRALLRWANPPPPAEKDIVRVILPDNGSDPRQGPGEYGRGTARIVIYDPRAGAPAYGIAPVPAPLAGTTPPAGGES